MNLLSTRFKVLVFSFLVLLSACKETSTPTDPVEGSWSLYSMVLKSDTEIPSSSTLALVHPSFYENQAVSLGKKASNVLTLNSDHTGNFNWDLISTPYGSIRFDWARSGDDELTLKPANDGAWVWSIRSMTEEFMEVDFQKVHSIDPLTSSTTSMVETFRFKFKKLE